MGQLNCASSGSASEETCGLGKRFNDPLCKVIKDTRLNFTSPAFRLPVPRRGDHCPCRKGEQTSGAPNRAHIFGAFEGLKPRDVRAVILGQNPIQIQPGLRAARVFPGAEITFQSASASSFTLGCAFLDENIVVKGGLTSKARPALRFPSIAVGTDRQI
jgi:hypothetical protein